MQERYTPVTFLIVAALVIAAWLARYDLTYAGGTGGYFLLDRWTGKVAHCLFDACRNITDD